MENITFILLFTTLLMLWGVTLKIFVIIKSNSESIKYDNKPITKHTLKILRNKQNKLANGIITTALIILFIIIIFQF